MFSRLSAISHYFVLYVNIKHGLICITTSEEYSMVRVREWCRMSSRMVYLFLVFPGLFLNYTNLDKGFWEGLPGNNGKIYKIYDRGCQTSLPTQTVNQSRQSTSQSASQSVDQSVDLSGDQSVMHSVNQTIN